MKNFKIHLQGDFGFIEIAEDCMLEMKTIQLPKVEAISATISILTKDTETRTHSLNQTEAT